MRTRPSRSTDISAERSLGDSSVVHNGSTTHQPPAFVGPASLYLWLQNLVRLLDERGSAVAVLVHPCQQLRAVTADECHEFAVNCASDLSRHIAHCLHGTAGVVTVERHRSGQLADWDHTTM